MVELCGAKLVPGTIDEAAEVPERPSSGAADGPGRGAAGDADRAEALLGVPRSGSTSRSPARGKTLTVDGPASIATTTSPARSTWSRRSAGSTATPRTCPSTLPATSGQVGRLTREQRLRRRAEDAMRDLGFDAVVNLSLTDPGMPGRLRIPDGDLRAEPIRVSNPLSADHSVDAHDAARLAARRRRLQPSPAAPSGWPCSSPAAPTFARGAFLSRASWRGSSSGERPPPAFEPWRIGALVTGSLPPGLVARATQSRPTSIALKGVLEGLARQLGAPVEVVPGDRAVPAPGPQRPRAGRRRRRPAGSARSTRSSAAPGTSRAPRRLRDRPGAAGGRLAGRGGDVRGRDYLSGRPPGPGRRRGRRRPGRRRSARPCSTGGGELLRSAEVFDLYRGEQVGEGRKSLALRLELPRRRSDPHRRGGRRAQRWRSRPPWRRSGGRSVA